VRRDQRHHDAGARQIQARNAHDEDAGKSIRDNNPDATARTM
jgi:hypothetical protein